MELSLVRNNGRYLALFLGSFVLSTMTIHSRVSVASDCIEGEQASGNMKVDVRHDHRAEARPNNCMGRVFPTNVTQDKPFRSYSFNEQGMLMISHNYGEGPLSKTTSSRVYHLFPRKQTPSVETLSTGEIQVRTSSSEIIRFSPGNGNITTFTGAEFKDDPRINRNNKGGLEITKWKGILLDLGWKLGENPSTSQEANATFRDPSGVSCTVKMKDIFNYTYYEYIDRNGRPKKSIRQVYFNFGTDAELKTWLAAHPKCGKLDLSSLETPAPSDPAADPIPAPESPENHGSDEDAGVATGAE